MHTRAYTKQVYYVHTNTPLVTYNHTQQNAPMYTRIQAHTRQILTKPIRSAHHTYKPKYTHTPRNMHTIKGRKIVFVNIFNMLANNMDTVSMLLTSMLNMFTPPVTYSHTQLNTHLYTRIQAHTHSIWTNPSRSVLIHTDLNTPIHPETCIQPHERK